MCRLGLRDITARMANQMDKNMENEMGTGLSDSAGLGFGV